jgi:hypothetical protein
MENEQSAVSKFLGETNENMFEQPKDNMFGEETIEPKQEEEVLEEKPLPFHKDPKVLKFIEKEVAKRTEQTGPKETFKAEEDEFKDVIESFTAIIGNDTPEKVRALNDLQKALNGSSQKAAILAEQKILEIQNREAEADKQAEEELDNAFDEIEETYDVDLSKNPKLRSEFVSFVEKIAPKNRNGEIIDYPDMNSAWETFSEIKKSTAQPSRAKELANRGMQRSAETTVKQDKNINWNAVDEYMDTLK